MMTHLAKQAIESLAEEMWEAVLARDPYTATTAGRKVTTFGRGDLAEAEATAAAAAARRDRLDAIDLNELDRTDRLTAGFVRHLLELDIEEPQRWWTGFGIAPYSGLWLSLIPRMLFAPIDLAVPAEAARFLKLADEFTNAVEAMRERVEAQAARGWRLPKPALPNARKTLSGNAAMAIAAVALAEDRPASDEVRAQVDKLVETRLKPAFDDLLTAIGPDYEAAAPEAAGMMHQPGGADAYRVWLRYHLGSELDPAELHQLGLDEVGRLAAEMARVRAKLFGHNDDEASFHERLMQDPKAKTASPEALEATYIRHLDRMAPVFERMFRKAPQSPAVVRRLPHRLDVRPLRATAGVGLLHHCLVDLDRSLRIPEQLLGPLRYNRRCRHR